MAEHLMWCQHCGQRITWSSWADWIDRQGSRACWRANERELRRHGPEIPDLQDARQVLVWLLD